MAAIDGLKKKKIERKSRQNIFEPAADFYFEKRVKRVRKVNSVKGLYLFLIFVLVVLATVFGIDSTISYKNQLTKNSQDIEQEISSGLEKLSSDDYEGAVEHFTKANGDLKKLKISLQEGGQYIPYFFYLPQSDSTLNEASRILKATSSITDSIVLTGNILLQLKQENETEDQNKLISEMTKKLSDLAIADLSPLKKASANLSDSEEILLNSKSAHYENLRKTLLSTIPEVKSRVNGISRIYEFLPSIFGVEGSKKYLILFQNNTELRPAGGFLGSFAVADFTNGKMEKLDFQTNIYKLDQPFIVKNPIAAPAEFQYLNANMALKDSNYEYDFSKSMKTVSDYYQKETAQNADGVIAIDTTLITNLLKIIGPIEMKDYGLTVTADNFLSEIEYIVEIGYFKDQKNWSENAPKKILAEMMPKLISKTFKGLSEKDTRSQIMSLITESLVQKHLLFYSTDLTTQKYFSDQNFNGQVKEVSGDYFFLSNANIGGLKSSLNIEESVNQSINIDNNGSISKEIKITRKHIGNGAWPDGENKTYNKMIVPKGSTLLGYQIVSGNDLPYSDWANRAKATVLTSEEDGKTIFSFWLNTKPKETSEMIVTYRLPVSINANENYSLLVQKQPGTIGSNYNIDIKAERKAIYENGKKLSIPIKFNLLEDTLLNYNIQ